MNSGLLSVGNTPEELDSLIQSFEYENQQIVKFIEKENQLLENLEKDIIQKKSEIESLQESSTQLDEETKRAHKQFIQNRDNCDSLRKTACVLFEHEVVLMKKLNALVVTGEQEKTDRGNVLQHYTNIWEDYKQKYESFPLAQTFLQKQKEVESSATKLDEVSKKTKELKRAIAELKGPDVDIYDMKHFLVAVGQLKLDTMKNCKMITVKREKLHSLEKDLHEVKERKEKQRLMEEERARVLRAEAEEEKEEQCVSESMPLADVREQGNMVDNETNQMNSVPDYGQTSVDSVGTEKSLGEIRVNSDGEEKSTLAHMYDRGDRMFQQPQKELTFQNAVQPTRTQPAVPQPYLIRSHPDLVRSQPLPSRAQSHPTSPERIGPQAYMPQRVRCDQQPGKLTHSYGVPSENLVDSQMITPSAHLRYRSKPNSTARSQLQSQAQPNSYFLLVPPPASPVQLPTTAPRAGWPVDLPLTPKSSGHRQPPITPTPITPRPPQLAVFKHPSQPDPDHGKPPPLRNDRSSACQAETDQQRWSPQDTGTVLETAVFMPQSPHVSPGGSLFQGTCPAPRTTKNNNTQERPSVQQVSEAELIPSSVSQSHTSGPAHSPSGNEPKTPEHRESGLQMSQPTTPAGHSTQDSSASPFNLEKHLERVRLLTKSPAAPQYSTRPMFATEPSAPKKQPVTEDGKSLIQDNPFIQSFFPDGRGDGNLFQSTFTQLDTTDSSGKSLFGGADNPAQSEEGQNMSFNFSGGDCSGAGVSDAGSAVFSLFGGGQTDTTAGDNDSFSFSFDSSRVRSPPPTPATSGFSLF